MAELIKKGSQTIAVVRKFLKETEVESKKVIWPDRKYVAAATVIVLVIVIVSAVYVMVIDLGFTEMFKFLHLMFDQRAY